MVNGEFVDCVGTRDRGFAYGDGVFETMRYRQGQIPLLSFHLERLQEGCIRLQIPVEPLAVRGAVQRFIQSLSATTTAVVKLTVTRGSGGRGYQPPPVQEISATIILQTNPLSEAPAIAVSGVTLQECSRRIFRNPQLAGIKHLNRLDYVLAALELPQTVEVQGLLLDDDDKLLETLHHNLFLITDERLRTPPLLAGGVHGVMRKIVLQKIAPGLQMVSREENLSLVDLLSADEVFLCNSVHGIWPVHCFSDRHWQTPGPVTARLQKIVDSLRDGVNDPEVQ